MKLEQTDQEKNARIKVTNWNIGHYCNGTGISTSITNSNYLQQRTKFRELFNEYGADLIGLVEYSDVFNASSGESAETAILSQYRNKSFGTVKASGYVCNGVVSNMFIGSMVQLSLPNDYYAYECTAMYMGVEFKVCVAHFPWQTEAMNLESAQILLDRYENEEKVIVMGDFNIFGTNLYELFEDAGFDLGNHGYMGDIVTYPASDSYLDNIMVKGGKILKTVVPMTELSDHLPVVCDIVI
jgi:endonuclease/exonuclease/phosphatase family metal-dependent hydrolase